MTWYYTPDGNSLDVYDHTGAAVANNRAFSGGWSGIPDEVYTVMYEEATAAFQAGDTQRVLRILAEAAFEQIEEGTP